MALVVCGLPQQLRERIDKSEIPSIGKLVSKINSFDRPATRSITNSIPNSSTASNAFLSLKRVPCPYCKKKGFERFHPEKECRIKVQDSQYCNSNNSNVNQTDNEKKAVHNVEVHETVEKTLENSKNE